MRIIRCLIVGLLVSASAPYATAQIQIEDTFTRGDDTLLGTSEIGGASYFESGSFTLVSAEEETAEVFSNELIVFGFDGFFGSAPGVANINSNLADVNFSATMRYEGLFSGSNTQSFAGGGFHLRRNGEEDAVPQRNEGLVEVYLLPSGGLFVRETHNGMLNTLYGFADPNPFGMGGSNTATYSGAGQLPTMFNGLPFDANGNGVLENDEAFQLGANLTGSSLDVLVNGQVLQSFALSRSQPVSFQSTPGLVKNRFVASGTADTDIANVAYDNLVISGSPYTVPQVRHQADTNPASELWFVTGGGVAINNGPVDDGGTAAWNINDATTGAFANWNYSASQDQLADISSEGWRMKGTIRVLGTDYAPSGGIELSVIPNSRTGYVLWLGADAVGNPIVGEFGGVLSTGVALGRTATINGTGYHDYEIVFDPLTDTADVFVDGTMVIDDMLPIELDTFQALNRILWGSNSSAGTGNANYSFVEFTVGAAPPMLTGDHNEDGVVDAADYVVWRKNPGNFGGQQGYDDWRDNFGNTAQGSGSNAAAAAPEPASWMLLAMAAVLSFRRKMCRR